MERHVWIRVSIRAFHVIFEENTMDYKQAVASYQKDSSKENINRLVGELCAEMTLREKTKLLHGSAVSFFSRIIFGGIFHGSIFYYPFTCGGCRRLGIPSIRFSDGSKGAVSGKGTCFPVPMMRGSSFDPELEYRVGKAMTREIIAAGANYFGGITINLVRNPRGGRSQESYSEDPFLLGQMGATLTKSVQEEGVIACPKHFALNSIENLRFLESSNCDERSLREIYLHQFKKCVDAGAQSIMAAYNKVNGVYCCENRQILSDILRDEWGFDGFTMSDFLWGVHDTAGALKAGLDTEMPISRFFSYRKIRKCINNGELSEEDVNRAVKNILRAMIRLTPTLKPQPKTVMKSIEHLELAEEAAVKGMVLLKNKNSLLPLPKTAKIVVVGPYADTVNVGDNGSAKVISKDGITPYAGLSQKLTNVSVYNGLDPQKALEAAADAEIVIACVGCDARDEGEFLINAGDKMTKKPSKAIGGDRDSLALNPTHLELLKRMKGAGKKVIAILYTGSVILTEPIEAYTDAIVMGYYGGRAFGKALASLVCGEKNFSGKLAVSIAKQQSDYPPFLEIGQKPYEIEYGYYNGYYLFEKNNMQPAYPFGYGLSYTNFEIHAIQIAKNDQDGISVTVSVANTGACTGAEVVQVYLGSAGASEDRPLKMLRGFKRVELVPGESKVIQIDVSADDLKFYNVQTKEWVLDPAYKVFIGNNDADAEYVGEVNVGLYVTPSTLMKPAIATAKRIGHRNGGT